MVLDCRIRKKSSSLDKHWNRDDFYQPMCLQSGG